MISAKAPFKDDLVLIPGWATDHRIFSALKLNYNYLLLSCSRPYYFKEELLKSLDDASIEKVSLLGWSLGGFLAAEFASAYPERVDALILVSMRKSYDAEKLKEIRSNLQKNKRAFLYKFYLECFSNEEKEELLWFKKNLLKDYINEMELEGLTEGLEYLAHAKIIPESLAHLKKIRIFHGKEDAIAPVEEGLQIKSRLSGAEWVCLPAAGHMPFLNRVFRTYFDDGDR